VVQCHHLLCFVTVLSGGAVSPITLHLYQYYQVVHCRQLPCIGNGIIWWCRVATCFAFVTVLSGGAVSPITLHLYQYYQVVDCRQLPCIDNGNIW